MKKSEFKTMIRKIVREEVALAIQEVITELRQPIQQVSEPKSKKKKYSKNSVLDSVLNETAESDEWKTMGDGVYDSNNMTEVMSNQYDINDKNNADIIIPGGAPPEIKNLFNRDYSSILKKSIEKSKQKVGG
jgi:hypothetical protein